jgi:hypothetical protein
MLIPARWGAAATINGELGHGAIRPVRRGYYVTFHMAEVTISKRLFADILRLIGDLQPPPVLSTA